jgi:hypothetical protein
MVIARAVNAWRPPQVALTIVRCVKPQYPHRINEIRDVAKGLTSRQRCKASTSIHPCHLLSPGPRYAGASYGDAAVDGHRPVAWWDGRRSPAGVPAPSPRKPTVRNPSTVNLGRLRRQKGHSRWEGSRHCAKSWRTTRSGRNVRRRAAVLCAMKRGPIPAVHIAQNTAPRGHPSGEMGLSAQAGRTPRHCAQHATVGFRRLGAATPSWNDGFCRDMQNPPSIWFILPIFRRPYSFAQMCRSRGRAFTSPAPLKGQEFPRTPVAQEHRR